MTTARPLSLELWLLVFQGMTYVPLAHRKTIETPRTNFQSSLAAICLTCKIFHDLASTLLYQYPIVHSLPLFIAELDTPAVPGLKSKAELFARTERLFLEPYEETEAGEPISEEAVEEYALSVGDKGGDKEGLKREMRVMANAESQLRAWRTLLDSPRAADLIFPRLSTVSTAAVGTGQSTWPGADRSARWASIIEENQEALFDFLGKVKTVRHYCEAGTGLLSLEKSIFFADPNRDLTITHHSSIYTPEFAPFCIGHRNNWLVHTDGHLLQDSDPEWALATADREIDSFLLQRQELAADEEYASYSNWSFNGGIFVGIPEEESDPEKEEDKAQLRKWAEGQTKRMGEKFTAAAPEGKTVRDAFEVKPLFDASCSACDWDGANASRYPGFGEDMVEHHRMMSEHPGPKRPRPML